MDINKILISAYNNYDKFKRSCDLIAVEAQKHINWNNDISCYYYPGDGICIEINEHVCSVNKFFELVDESKSGFIDERTYYLNCI